MREMIKTQETENGNVIPRVCTFPVFSSLLVLRTCRAPIWLKWEKFCSFYVPWNHPKVRLRLWVRLFFGCLSFWNKVTKYANRNYASFTEIDSIGLIFPGCDCLERRREEESTIARIPLSFRSCFHYLKFKGEDPHQKSTNQPTNSTIESIDRSIDRVDCVHHHIISIVT